ncbi:MAG: hypothetical protein ACI4DV_07110 [Lachnospiraceae bacterium]
MSQEKVNQYKESKRNRKEEIARNKRKGLLMKIVAGLILAAICGWLIYSVVLTLQTAEGPEVTVDTTAIDDYYESVTE